MQTFDVFSSSFGTDASDGGPEIPTVSLRRAGEDDGSDQDEADIWSAYGFAYRPAAPDAKGATQVVADFVAGRWSVIASRDTRGADVFGALNEGDVVVWSIGGVALRMNADGSTSLFKKNEGETPDAFVSIASDSAITLCNEWGTIQISSDGISLMLNDGSAGLQISAADGVNIVGQKAAFQVGSISLGVGASVPLCIIPTIPGTGSVSAGFVCAKPTPNILV